MGTNRLPTPLNLCRWRIKTDPKCPLCSWPKPTEMYVHPEWVYITLNQGRYTWPTESVVHTIAKSLVPALSESESLPPDLPVKAGNKTPATVPTELSGYQTLLTDLEAHPQIRKVSYSTIDEFTQPLLTTSHPRLVWSLSIAHKERSNQHLSSSRRSGCWMFHLVFRARQCSSWDNHKPVYSLC